jgi:hypothetical protein
VTALYKHSKFIVVVEYQISAPRIALDLSSLEEAQMIGPSIIADLEIMEKLGG